MLNFSTLEKLFKENDIFYEKEVSMKNLTSFKIGGRCKFVCYPENFKQLKSLIIILNKEKIPNFFLGNGSNILFKDSDFSGVAICSKKLNKISILKNNKVYCQSGANLFKLCNFLYLNSLSNLEKLYGIPGTLGGAILMNAGAYGTEIKDFLYSVSHMDYLGNIYNLKVKEIDFSYRFSSYQKNGFFIISAILNLKKQNKEKIKNKMDLILKKRKEKQPLNFPNAGSIFKRPKGYFAAKLIEECGLKGVEIGGAKISTKHAGFIVNFNNATALDVKNLIEKIKKIVKTKTNVDLKTEIKFIE